MVPSARADFKRLPGTGPSDDNRLMGVHLVRASLGTLAMLVRAVVAAAAIAFVPIPPLLGEKDLRVPGLLLAAVLCGVGFALKFWLRWPAVDLIASLVAAEILALCIIGLFSGMAGRQLFDAFNVWWLVHISAFVAALVDRRGGRLGLPPSPRGGLTLCSFNPGAMGAQAPHPPARTSARRQLRATCRRSGGWSRHRAARDGPPGRGVPRPSGTSRSGQVP